MSTAAALAGPDHVRARFVELCPAVDFCSLRMVEERTETLTVRNDVVEPVTERIDAGAMVTVVHHGGLGYAATSDLSRVGLKAALDRARSWADRTAAHSVFDFSRVLRRTPEASTAHRSVPPGTRFRCAKNSTCCAARWR